MIDIKTYEKRERERINRDWMALNANIWFHWIFIKKIVSLHLISISTFMFVCLVSPERWSEVRLVVKNSCFSAGISSPPISYFILDNLKSLSLEWFLFK